MPSCLRGSDNLLAKDTHPAVGFPAVAVADQISRPGQLVLLAADGRGLGLQLRRVCPLQEPLDGILGRNTRSAFSTRMRPIQRDGGQRLENFGANLWFDLRGSRYDALNER